MNLTSSLKRRLPLVLTGGMLAALTALPAASTAAAPTYTYNGSAGGTRITAVGLVVSSDLTAKSQAIGPGPNSDSNNVARVTVGQLARVGAVTTDVTGGPAGDGSTVTSHARTAGIRLLGGLIKVNAIDTTATATGNSAVTPNADAKSTLLGLTIAGKKYPLDLPQNTVIRIPGIASIAVNVSNTGANDQGAAVVGAGLVVTLLTGRNGAAAGAQIVANPVFASVRTATATSNGRPVGGQAYGSYVHVGVGDALTVESGPTAEVGMPSYGTDGAAIENNTARLYLSGALSLRAIHSSGEGVQSPALSEVTESSSVASLNLFHGLITARAIGTTAYAGLKDGVSGQSTLNGSLQFINLRIAGKAIPINIAPNTTINVANLGRVTINEQISSDTPGKARGMSVIGLHVVLDTSRAGLPVGANIEIATSRAVVFG